MSTQSTTLRRSRLSSGNCIRATVTDQDTWFGGDTVEVIEKQGAYWYCRTYRPIEYPPLEPEEFGLFRREDLVTEEDARNGYH